MATEEITYRVTKIHDDIELRQYDEAVSAVVEVLGERRDAIGSAFRILFDYIQGNNVAAQTISMTVPVSQTVSQSIPMTAPVSQVKTASGKWAVAFYMPNDMTLETTPKPLDERVSIRPVAAKRMAAITFSGRGSDDNIAEHEQLLRDHLKTNRIPYHEGALYAFYDAPYVPWFLRRNEVLFEINNDVSQ